MTPTGGTRKSAPDWTSNLFRTRLREHGARTSPETIERAASIHPGIIEATMMATGSWVSWEMVHFLSETADGRNDK